MGISVMRATNRRGVRRVPMAKRVRSRGVGICRVPLSRIPTPIRGIQPRSRLRHSNRQTHRHRERHNNRPWRITRVGFMPLRRAGIIPFRRVALRIAGVLRRTSTFVVTAAIRILTHPRWCVLRIHGRIAGGRCRMRRGVVRATRIIRVVLRMFYNIRGIRRMTIVMTTRMTIITMIQMTIITTTRMTIITTTRMTIITTTRMTLTLRR